MSLKSVLVLVLGALAYMAIVGFCLLSDDQIYGHQFFGCVGSWRPFPKLTGRHAIPERFFAGLLVSSFALNYIFGHWKPPSFQKLFTFIVVGLVAVLVVGIIDCPQPINAPTPAPPLVCTNSEFRGVKASGPIVLIQPDISGKKARAAAGESAVNEDSWEFVKYVPSVLETKWVTNIEAWQEDICKYSVNFAEYSSSSHSQKSQVNAEGTAPAQNTEDAQAQTKQFQEWIETTGATSQPLSHKETEVTSVAESSLPHEIFSKFLYKTKRSERTKLVFIEPLATVLRHPRYCQEFLVNHNWGAPVVLQKNWLYMSWSIGEQLLSAGRQN
jgi:hypothetical protein